MYEEICGWLYNQLLSLCQKVKTQHKHSTELLHPIPIPKCKWWIVSIDFTTNMSIRLNKHDSIMFAVDKLTKDFHFIPMKSTHKRTNVVEIYMREIVRLHGIPK